MRTSRKCVQNLCNSLSDDNERYNLICHDCLGNRKKVYYEYSVVKLKPVKNDYVTQWICDDTIIYNKFLKVIYDFLLEKLNKKYP